MRLVFIINYIATQDYKYLGGNCPPQKRIRLRHIFDEQCCLIPATQSFEITVCLAVELGIKLFHLGSLC
jgi:hypothetical protein